MRAAKRRLQVCVTGAFDVQGFMRMTDKLSVRGDVQSTFFDAESSTMRAAATFMFTTEHDEHHVRALLEQVHGVEHVQMESNHA